MNAIPLNEFSLNAIPLKNAKIVYKNSAILLSKVRTKYKKHSTGLKNYKWWNNNIIKMCCMW